jgi:hypothetical protein
VFAPDGALAVHPTAVSSIGALLGCMYQAAFADDGREVARLGELVRGRVAREFVAADSTWGAPGRYVPLEEIRT